MSKTILRSGTGVLGGVFMGAMAIPGLIAFLHTRHSFVLLWSAVVAIAGVRAAREAVVLHPDGLTIRNPLRTYRLSWSDVAEVSTPNRKFTWATLLPLPSVVLRTRDGRAIRLGVTRTVYQSMNQIDAKVALIRERWQAATTTP